MSRNLILILFVFIFSGFACGSGPGAGDGLQLELPAITEKDDVVEHLGYVASLNHDRLIPNWVAYELTREELKGNEKRDTPFQWDPDIKGRQAWREDYSGSGWDKGHMVPRSDLKWSAKAYSESFYFSNICPQNHEFKSGSWMTTENMAKRLANQYGSVYIVCGPLVFDNHFGTIGQHKVTVPDAFFKAFLICDRGEYYAIGIVMRNWAERQDLKASAVTVDAVEELCGFDLFSSLERTVQEVAESKIVWSKWGI